MYIAIPIIIVILIIFSFLFCFRRKCIIRKIRCMSLIDKLNRLNCLIGPLGFQYILSQDMFTSCLTAWQREYGYCSFYDRTAPHFNIVFDCEPIYFDCHGHTWLIEFWKGQYGINMGAEIGIYKADRLLSENERSSALFHSAGDDELPEFALTLIKDGNVCLQICRKHWWLTAFSMGNYAQPEQLRVEYSITFPTVSMCDAFVASLLHAGYERKYISVCAATVSFTFDTPLTNRPSLPQIFVRSFAQWKNRLFLRLYKWATRPFCFTFDRLLYLYEYMPFAFRHMVRVRNIKKKRKKKRK